MILLINTTNGFDQIISRHRTIKAAVEADRKLQAQVKRANGRDAYLMTVIRSSDGDDIREQVAEVRYNS